MAILHVRGIPDDLVEQVKDMARAEKRSLSAEVTVLLRQAVSRPERRQADVLAEIRSLRFRPAPQTPDTTELLREDRDR